MSDVPNFQEILEAFRQHNVRAVLIGGVAMRLHGSAHITDDVDFCYGRDADNLAALVAALAPSRPKLRGSPEGLPFFWDVRTLKNVLNLTLTTDIGILDLLGEAPGVTSFDELWTRSVEMEAHGIPIRVASLDDLIAMKRAANRPKDQAHLMELLALKRLTEEQA